MAKAALAATAGAERKSEFEPQQEMPGRFGALASRDPFVQDHRPGGEEGAGTRLWVSSAPPRAGPASGSWAEDCGRGASSPIIAPVPARTGVGRSRDKPSPCLMNMRCGCGCRALGLAGAGRGGRGTAAAYIRLGARRPPSVAR